MSEEENKQPTEAKAPVVEHTVMLTDNLVGDLLFMVRWHLSFNNTQLTKIAPMYSYVIQLGLLEDTEMPEFLSGFGDMDLFEADVVEGMLSTGESVQILDYFSKARSVYYGRAFIVAGDVMMQKTISEGWYY